MAKSRPRQRHLPHTDPEPRVIKEIETAADNYREVRDERMNLTHREVELKATLRESMQKHKLKKYEYANYIVEFVEEKPADVKVRTKKPPKGEEVE